MLNKGAKIGGMHPKTAH